MADFRNRNWACILYPSEDYCRSNNLCSTYDGHSGWGSLPDDFIDILRSFHVPMFLSPCHLHDKEEIIRTSEDGHSSTVIIDKKPHFHLMLMFEGNKSSSQLNSLLEPLNATKVFQCNSLRGYARYLCHLDDPEKTQYLIDQVLCFGGADYLDAINLPKDDFNVLCSMLEYIRKSKVPTFFEFTMFCMDHRPDWLKVISHRYSFLILNVIQSYFRQLHSDDDTKDAISVYRKWLSRDTNLAAFENKNYLKE